VFQGLNPGITSAPDFLAGQPETTSVSPDGKTLLMLTSGYNISDNKDTTGEWVFIFDISTGLPDQSQAVKIPNAFSGLVWAPDGSAFYVAGGQDDNVHVFTRNGGQWVESGSPIPLNHTAYGVPQPAGNGLFSLPGFGAATSPLAAGLGITADGKTLIVANLENDSISFVDLVQGVKSFELDLRPGRSNPAQSGVPGGEFPFWIAVNGDARTGRPSDTVYVSSERDREIVVVSLSGGAPQVKTRITVKGNPNRLVLNRAQTRLYVTADNEDALHVINTLTNRVVASVNTVAPAATFDSIGRKDDAAEDGDRTTRPKGASPNSVSLSPDEKIAYVTNGGTQLRGGHRHREPEAGGHWADSHRLVSEFGLCQRRWAYSLYCQQQEPIGSEPTIRHA
jgi:DNA-binding beta-propeller fold protein YncE